jgi:2-iminobutanoate/2-iminopropanoate deaminase
MLTPVNPPDAAWPGVSQGMIINGRGMFVSTGHVGTDEGGEIVTESL